MKNFKIVSCVFIILATTFVLFVFLKKPSKIPTDINVGSRQAINISSSWSAGEGMFGYELERTETSNEYLFCKDFDALGNALALQGEPGFWATHPLPCMLITEYIDPESFICDLDTMYHSLCTNNTPNLSFAEYCQNERGGCVSQNPILDWQYFSEPGDRTEWQATLPSGNILVVYPSYGYFNYNGTFPFVFDLIAGIVPLHGNRGLAVHNIIAADDERLVSKQLLDIPLMGDTHDGEAIRWQRIPVEDSVEVLRVVYETLFSDAPRRYYAGEYGPHNYVNVDGWEFNQVTLVDGMASLYLSGRLAGFTKTQRDQYVREQIEAAAFQFDTVDTLQVYLNEELVDFVELLDLNHHCESETCLEPDYWIAHKD